MIRLLPAALLLISGIVADDEGRSEKMHAAIIGLVESNPRHRLHDDNTRTEFVRDMDTVGAETEIDPYLLLAVMYLEASLNTSAVGSRGEIGLMQVHGVAAHGCDLRTQQGQMRCGARWLRECHNKCGTWERALTAYATGKCTHKSERVKRLIRYRVRFWERLKNASNANRG